MVLKSQLYLSFASTIPRVLIRNSSRTTLSPAEIYGGVISVLDKNAYGCPQATNFGRLLHIYSLVFEFRDPLQKSLSKIVHHMNKIRISKDHCSES